MVASAPTAARNSRTSRLLPVPAGARTVTSSQAGPPTARSKAARSVLSSDAPPDQRRVEAPQVRLGPGDGQQPICARAARRDRATPGRRAPPRDRVAHQLEGQRPEQDLAGLRGGLQARGGVDGVAGHHRLAVGRHPPRRPRRCGRRCAARGGCHGGHRASTFRASSAGARSAAARTARRASSSCSVGQAEDGHDRVADVLLDRPAVALDDLAEGGEVAGLEGAEGLGVEALADARRADTRSAKRTVTNRRDSPAPSVGESGAAQARQNRARAGSPRHRTRSGVSLPSREMNFAYFSKKVRRAAESPSC